MNNLLDLLRLWWDYNRHQYGNWEATAIQQPAYWVSQSEQTNYFLNFNDFENDYKLGIPDRNQCDSVLIEGARKAKVCGLELSFANYTHCFDKQMADDVRYNHDY